jgi:Kef-type K+ transport system membrane component KefB
LPIAFSFCLLALADVTPLKAFAAGAALSSTSLGTTFTVLSTSGLTTTRLGTVLTTAAMLDDVVGLTMVQVISDIGSSASSFSIVTVIRPVAVLVGLVIILSLACRFAVRPGTYWLNEMRKIHKEVALQRVLSHQQTPLVIHTSLLVAMVSGATYAGTSELFAAYLAGASISWWDSDVQHPSRTPKPALVSPITDTTQGNSGVEPAGPALATQMEAPEKNMCEKAMPETDSGRHPVSTD